MDSLKKIIKDKIKNFGILNIPISVLAEIDEAKPILHNHLHPEAKERVHLRNIQLSISEMKRNGVDTLLFFDESELEDQLLRYEEFKLNRKYNFVCPYCGSKRTVKIVYGYPTPALKRLEENHKIKIGGSVISGNIDSTGRYHRKNRYCENCGNSFSSFYRKEIAMWKEVTKEEYIKKAQELGLPLKSIEEDIAKHEENSLAYFFEQITG